MMMKNILRNDKGTSLIEVISVVLISTILIAVSAVGVIAFYKSYNKIDSYVSLQQGVMETLHMMRYGLRMPARPEQLQTLARYDAGATEYWGISNAGRIELPGFQPFLGYGNRVKMFPATLQTTAQGNDYLEYYLDDGAIRATYIYRGNRIPSPLQIFPKKKDADRVEVTGFRVYNENVGEYFTPIEGNVIALVGVEIEARVLIKDDPLPYRREFETVRYKTTIAKKYAGK
jgi:hypothetical protein